MVPSGLHGPERWRGRVRGRVPTWSVLPAAAVVILCGGFFWASVWLVFLKPTTERMGMTHDGLDVAAWAAGQRADPGQDGTGLDGTGLDSTGLDGTGLDSSAEAIAALLERPVVPDGSLAAAPAADIVLPLTVLADEPGEPADVAELAEGASLADLGGPVLGPAVPDGFVPGAAVAEDAVEQPVAEAGEPGAESAGELAARAEALTVVAEALTVKIEGLTNKIEELEAKLEASRGAPAVRPAAVPSPVAVARPGATGGVTADARASQAPPSGRAPWVVMPRPEPGSRVTAGPIVVEARARGESPIAQIQIVLDGTAQAVVLERRDERTWLGRATARVNPGRHAVTVTVVDSEGRTGSYRWQFEAAGS